MADASTKFNTSVLLHCERSCIFGVVETKRSHVIIAHVCYGYQYDIANSPLRYLCHLSGPIGTT